MKKLLLVISLMAIGLSGCYVRGYHDEGYDRDRGHEGDRHGDRDRDSVPEHDEHH